MLRTSTIWPVLLLMLPAAAAHAETFPGQAPDSNLIKTQRKVDALFETGKYERAFFIHRNELAPLGDKYSQYMIGFMYLTGKGVDADPVLASAWFRLAAERGRDAYQQERDRVMTSLDERQRALSDQAHAALLEELGDKALLVRLIEADVERAREYRQDRSFGRVQEFQGTLGRSVETTYRQLVDRLEARLDYLDRRFIASPDIEGSDKEALTELVRISRYELRRFKAVIR